MGLDNANKSTATALPVSVSVSRIHGVGIFAAQVFGAGERIATLTGPLVRHAQVPSDGTDLFPDLLGLAPDLWLRMDSPFCFVNHSCMPTAWVGARRRLLALNDIAPGQEITIDYSTTECDPHWRMTSKCGTAACRRTLLPIQHTFNASPPAPPALLRLWKQMHRGATT